MNTFVFPDRTALMKQTILELKACLLSVSASDANIREQFNWWFGLAKSARSKVFQEEQPNLEWADLAIHVYEMMDWFSPNGCESCLSRAMMLRANLIRRLGTKLDDKILDSQIIINWFFENLPMTREEAENKIKLRLKELYDRYFKDMAAMRKIKNRLNVIKVLTSNGIQSGGEINFHKIVYSIISKDRE